MATLYEITANTIEKLPTGAGHRKTHPFFVMAFSVDDAETLARRIVNPTGNPDLTVEADAVECLEKPQPTADLVDSLSLLVAMNNCNLDRGTDAYENGMILARAALVKATGKPTGNRKYYHPATVYAPIVG